MTDSRLMTLEEAASYCSLSESGYKAAVKRRVLPGPVAGMKRYDRAAIDKALDKASGIEQDASPDPLSEWERENAGAA